MTVCICISPPTCIIAVSKATDRLWGSIPGEPCGRRGERRGGEGGEWDSTRPSSLGQRKSEGEGPAPGRGRDWNSRLGSTCLRIEIYRLSDIYTHPVILQSPLLMYKLAYIPHFQTHVARGHKNRRLEYLSWPYPFLCALATCYCTSSWQRSGNRLGCSIHIDTYTL